MRNFLSNPWVSRPLKALGLGAALYFSGEMDNCSSKPVIVNEDVTHLRQQLSKKIGRVAAESAYQACRDEPSVLLQSELLLEAAEKLPQQEQADCLIDGGFDGKCVEAQYLRQPDAQDGGYQLYVQYSQTRRENFLKEADCLKRKLRME